MTNFNAENHEYTNQDGKVLMSVTTAIKTFIQKNLYAGVPEAILKAAAQRGTDIHARIDARIKGMPFADECNYPEVGTFFRYIAEKTPLTLDFSEMIVSDDETLAGTIDIVAYDDDVPVIIDIKTTSVLNMEYVQWQLSLYAYLFEYKQMSNHTQMLEVGNIGCMWLHNGRWEYVRINRLPTSAIDSLLQAIRDDAAETWQNPMHAAPDDAEALVKEYRELYSDIIDSEAVVSSKKQRMEAILVNLKDIADREGKTEMHTEYGIVKRGKDVKRKTFSKDLFLSAHPECEPMMDDGMKESVTAGKAKIVFD